MSNVHHFQHSCYIFPARAYVNISGISIYRIPLLLEFQDQNIEAKSPFVSDRRFFLTNMLPSSVPEKKKKKNFRGKL